MKFAATMLAALALAYALGLVLTIPANPEVQFWHSVVQLRDKEIAAVRKEQPNQPIIFFTGGSSCAFSIDPKIIEETCGMPALNLGLPVAAGPKYLLHQALDKTRPSDILVVCLEPDLLTYPDPFNPSTFGFGMATMVGHPSDAVGGTTFDETLSLRELLNLSRPGPGYLTTWIAKAATGTPYRYKQSDIRYRGRIETQVRDASLPLAGAKKVRTILPHAHQLLNTFRNAAQRKGVRLFYCMPWLLSDPNAANQSRTANMAILCSIEPIIPTIDDGFQGVATDPAYFSDSGLHLSATGSAIRSQSVAKALKKVLTDPPR